MHTYNLDFGLVESKRVYLLTVSLPLSKSTELLSLLLRIYHLIEHEIA